MVTKSLPLRDTSNRLLTFVQFIYYILEGIVLFFIPQSWRPHKDVSGQTVLITGAGSGIGQLMAVKFAQLGCTTVLWDINTDGLQQTLTLIKEKKVNVKNVHSYQINLANREEIYELSKRVKDEVGPVDVLINNAGVVSGNCFLDNPDEKLQLTFNVNTFAHYYTIKCFLPDMIKQKRGHIVTVSSVLGNVVGCKLSDYCGSKFANVGMEMALRMELTQAGLSDYIKTTIVKPYMILTGMFAGTKSLPIIPPLEPDYVAQKIVTGVLTEATEVTIPYIMVVFYYLFMLLPSKALVSLIDLTGAFDAMKHFEGRKAVTNKEELNNN